MHSMCHHNHIYSSSTAKNIHHKKKSIQLPFKDQQFHQKIPEKPLDANWTFSEELLLFESIKSP